MALVPAKLRELDINELELRAAELQKEMFDLRQALTTKEEPNTSLLRDKKKDYARVLTILTEKQREGAEA